MPWEPASYGIPYSRLQPMPYPLTIKAEPMSDQFDPTTNPDVQEARSKKYSNETVMLLPLSSGNLAIFGRDGQLHAILHDAPTKEEIHRLSRELKTKIYSLEGTVVPKIRPTAITVEALKL